MTKYPKLACNGRLEKKAVSKIEYAILRIQSIFSLCRENSMKKITTLLSLFSAFMVLSAHAEVKLEDNSKLLGKWQVTAEALALDREKKALQVTWEFQKEGTLVTTGEDARSGIGEMTVPIKYSVSEGVIKKQVTPGREKYEDCAVVEMEGNNMILKCKFLYFFMTKK